MGAQWQAPGAGTCPPHPHQDCEDQLSPGNYNHLLTDWGKRDSIERLESAVALLMPGLQFGGCVPAALVPPGGSGAAALGAAVVLRLPLSRTHQLPSGFARHRTRH